MIAEGHNYRQYHRVHAHDINTGRPAQRRSRHRALQMEYTGEAGYEYVNLSTLVSSCEVHRRPWSPKVTTIDSTTECMHMILIPAEPASRHRALQMEYTGEAGYEYVNLSQR